MARISSESVNQVRDAADMVAEVGRYTDLRRAGAQMMGLCPFHDESSPSFSVDPTDKLYHCFGCGVAGDIFGFVMEKEALGFTEAVEALADRYGVELHREQEDPRAEARRQRRQRLQQLLERSASYYANYLWESREAGKARAYLAERGLTESALRDFAVGYAPSAWDKILLAGQRAGFRVEELRAVGLVQQSRQGGEYDRFRSRIMFPIRDARGRTLGFGGRAMRDDQGAKYVNTAETDFFHKSQILYGLDRARAAMARANRAVVVEGYTDVIALHQAGVEGTVAVMGTAITPDQVKALSGVVSEVVLALDADEAGQAAMVRVQGVAGERRMRLRVAAMPKGVDPAEMMLEEKGAERFRAVLDGAAEFIDFRVNRVLDRTDRSSSPEERSEALDEVAPVIAAMRESPRRTEIEGRVASHLEFGPATVKARVVLATPATGGDVSQQRQAVDEEIARRSNKPSEQLSARERWERALLAMCIAHPGPGADYLERLNSDHLSPSGQAAAAFLRAHPADPADHVPRENGALAALITELLVIAREEPGSEDAMEINFLRLEQRRLEGEIEAAGERGDYERRASLSRERAALVERIAHAQRVGS